jgi:plastocyanin
MRSIHAALARPFALLSVALAALFLVLAACTGDSSTSAAASASPAASSAESAEPSAAASSEASESAAGGETVTIANFSFGTEELTVAAGTTVRFVNEDAATHTVTEGQDGNAADGARFDDQVASGAWVEVTFDEPGDVNVTCLFHGNMNLVVHVE